MEIILNNKTLIIPHDYTINELLDSINSLKSVIVFVNGKKLLLSEYNSYRIKDNDAIRVIRPLGGG